MQILRGRCEMPPPPETINNEHSLSPILANLIIGIPINIVVTNKKR
jgi:hypothetical protein